VDRVDPAVELPEREVLVADAVRVGLAAEVADAAALGVQR
jgi:hypothetical protein